ncbi:MAG: hypothetical protein QME75_06045 [Deltaproteobacteria bacterium]|nr:hypothetical protein [Deltaproteobacteria bacterium]
MGLSGLFSAAGWPADWPLSQEVLDLAAGRLCHADRRRACRLENGAFAAWACQECREFRRPESISPWTWHLMLLYQLKKAGYPFKANDLSLETWMLLGLVGRLYEAGKSANKA